MLAVGYSDAQRVFVVRNSWGQRWGDKGYCYIPYDYMTDPSLCADCWTIRAVSDLDFQPKSDAEDDGFYDEEATRWDPSIPSEYSFTELEKAGQGAMIGIAAGFVPSGDDVEDDDDDEGEEEAAEVDGYDVEPVWARVACGGLSDPTMAEPIRDFFACMDGVLEVHVDLDTLMVKLALNPDVTSPDDIWAAVENDPNVQASWIE
jgi:hypothetical protein